MSDWWLRLDYPLPKGASPGYVGPFPSEETATQHRELHGPRDAVVTQDGPDVMSPGEHIEYLLRRD